MTHVPLLIHKSQKVPHLEPYSGMCDREIEKMTVFRQITERVTMSIPCEQHLVSKEKGNGEKGNGENHPICQHE